jgi:hypothetical protein
MIGRLVRWLEVCVGSIKWWLASLSLVAACGSEESLIGANLDGQGDPSKASDAGVSSRRDGGDVTGGGASNGNTQCTKRAVLPTRTTPDMLVVLDRSGSMAPGGNDRGTDRWSGSVAAVTEVVERFEDRVSFGLMTFPNAGAGGRGGNTQQCAAGSVNVPVGGDTSAAIASVLERMNPGGYTPTAATLEAVRGVIGETVVVDAVVPPKYVLLVTDGDPNCSGSWSSGSGFGQPDPEARQQTIAAIEALTELGVRTFVVGYQTADTGFAQQLDMMAAAGGTGERQHRSVDSGDDLVSAFEEIADRAVSCSYKLEKPVTDASYVLVTVNGKSRAFGSPADGWTLGPDMQTITLTGASCDAVQDGQGFTVEVVCDRVTVI